MLIPRDVWELVATVPLPKILKNCSPSTTRPPATSEAPLKSSEPSSLLQQYSGILQKSSSEVCALFQQSSAIMHIAQDFNCDFKFVFVFLPFQSQSCPLLFFTSLHLSLSWKYCKIHFLISRLEFL